MDAYNLQNEVTDKYTLRGRVYEKIREDILVGNYKKNEAVIESKVARELGVSRTPVREALRQLELEELVTIIPNKGAVVAGINAADIADIYAIRSRVEGLAASRCARHMTPDILSQFEEIIMLSEFHYEKGNMEQLYELDNRFHHLLYVNSKSRMLSHMLMDFHHYAQRVRRISLLSKERAKDSIAEHKAIVDALKAGDQERAETLTNNHVMLTMKNMNEKRITQELEK